MNEIIQAEQFHSKNYETWARRAEAILASKDLEKFLEKAANVNDDKQSKDQKKCYAILLSLISDNILAILINDRTPAQIWQKLESTYQKEGVVHQIIIRKQLSTLKIEKNGTIQNHIDNVMRLTNQLRLAGSTLTDLDVVVFLLMSLSSDYESTRSAIENQPYSHLSLEFVTPKL